jgi:hypothetical protein
MSNIELTHDIMRKLTAALGKVDSGNLRHFERINLVAEAFGWKGDALMHYLKNAKVSKVPVADENRKRTIGGVIDMFFGESAAARMGYIAERAAVLSENYGVSVYGADDFWSLRDKAKSVGLVILSLKTLDDWKRIVKLARLGNRVLVDVNSGAFNTVYKTLPNLGASANDMALIASLVTVSETVGDDQKPYSIFEHLSPFGKDVDVVDDSQKLKSNFEHYYSEKMQEKRCLTSL